jgi:hypothetical protein
LYRLTKERRIRNIRFKYACDTAAKRVVRTTPDHSWKKALTLFFAGKVEIIEEHDREIHAITFAIKLPSIIAF